MRFTKIILAGLIALGGLWTSDTYAAEKRCTELGANCVCSEPFGASSYPSGTTYLNPSDSVPGQKECSGDAFSDPAAYGNVSVRPAGDLFASNDATVLSRLPGRQAAMQYFLRGPEGHVSGWELGHIQANGYASRTQLDSLLPGVVHGGSGNHYVSKKRAAVRWYTYYSDTYTGAGSGACTNSKYMFSESMIWSTGYAPSLEAINYDFIGFGPNFASCCLHGPRNAGESAGPSEAQRRGKWLRFEVVITNRLGGPSPNGYREEAFIKNVTDNIDYGRVLDSRGYGTPSGGAVNSWHGPDNMVPPENTTEIKFLTSLYRAGTCLGWNGIAYYIYAQWDTDEGQRIGPAYEIEGGGSLPSTPSPVMNMRIQ